MVVVWDVVLGESPTTALKGRFAGLFLRPATSDDLYQSGQFVQVPDDVSGNAVFVRAGDPDQAVIVQSPHATAGERTADVAVIKYPDGTTKLWPYADVVPAV